VYLRLTLLPRNREVALTVDYLTRNRVANSPSPRGGIWFTEGYF
jgi:hypothetical protein